MTKRRPRRRHRKVRPLTIREILSLSVGPPWSEFGSDEEARRAYETHPEQLAAVRADSPVRFYFDEEGEDG